MNPNEILYRYLKSVEPVDKNAKILSKIIKANRNIDAVLLKDNNKIDDTKILLKSANLSFCLLNIEDSLVLIYPSEQREQYLAIQKELELGNKYIETTPLTYSEKEALKDFLNAKNIQFKLLMQSSDIKIAVEEKYKKDLNNAVKLLNKEKDSPEGLKYLQSKNLYWYHMLQVFENIHNTEISVFIGSEAGVSGIKIDKEKAVIINSAKRPQVIYRYDSLFDRKVLDCMINDLNGTKTPVKLFTGIQADFLSADINENYKGLTSSSATELLEVKNINKLSPKDIDNLLNEINEFPADKQRAVYIAMRKRACQDLKFEEINKYKLTKQEKELYKNMHQNNIEMFVDQGKEKEREDNGEKEYN